MPSFDIVSELEIFEVNHAVQNTQKEIATRFDFRGQDVSIELNEKNKEIKISTEGVFTFVAVDVKGNKRQIPADVKEKFLASQSN
jgi:uncharacterized protein YajQ (UPF0234 family)